MPQRLHPEAFPSQQKLLSMSFSKENLDRYEAARSSVDARQPFHHDGKDWLVTKIVMSVSDECEIYGIPYQPQKFDARDDDQPKWTYAPDKTVRPSHR